MKGSVDFGAHLRAWDGFGVNYVAAAQTRDWGKWPQDYGSFELLSESDRRAIIDLIFGDDGLRPGIGKMFIDSLQAGMTKPPGVSDDPAVLQPGIYDHETTTRWMRWFWREGLKVMRARGEEPRLVATLYGPAPWMTKQKILRGRDLDPAEKVQVAKYIISFAKHMRENEGIPIRFLSLHNEGGIEEARRWPADGRDGPEYAKHDYNCLWPVETVVEFITLMRGMLDRLGMSEVAMGNGECTRLDGTVKYVEAIVKDRAALAAYGLVTSHGFGRDDTMFTSAHLDPIRRIKPDFHGWVTSASWGKMDLTFLRTIHNHITVSKVNGYIPWAVVQRHSQWVGGDPNPGTAILIDDNGGWSVQRGYYLFKHYCRVGRPGMAVARSETPDPEVLVTAFASAGSGSPDAAVVLNTGDKPQRLDLRVEGARGSRFAAVVTDDSRTYARQPDAVASAGVLPLDLPPRSVLTLEAVGG
jgi:O-glycosyl hydrolase